VRLGFNTLSAAPMQFAQAEPEVLFLHVHLPVLMRDFPAFAPLSEARGLASTWSTMGPAEPNPGSVLLCNSSVGISRHKIVEINANRA
jgi:hypothetical protein